MSSNVAVVRRRKAFNEGRRSTLEESPHNPFDNATLHALWEKGRTMQLAFQVKGTIPPREAGEYASHRPLPKGAMMPPAVVTVDRSVIRSVESRRGKRPAFNRQRHYGVR
jgi:hypothetical protein